MNIITKYFAKSIGIDLGTANTLVYVKGKGIVLREPSVVAIRKEDREILAVGEDAKRMIGRTPGNIIAIRPMKDGVIADFDITQVMLKSFIAKAYKKNSLIRPRVMVCVPTGVTEVEKRAVLDATNQAGAKQAYIIEEPMAAAIGAGLKVDEPSGNMVVDIGGGTTEVATISLGGVVTSNSIRIGGDEMDDAIVQYIKKKYNLLIGDRSAEEIKISIGNAYFGDENNEIEIRGRDLVRGLPKSQMINAAEVYEALKPPVNDIIQVIKQTLETTPPELSSDIMDKGIVLAGGGSMLEGLDKLVSEETGMPVIVTENALDSVVEGTGKALNEMELLQKVAVSSKRIS